MALVAAFGVALVFTHKSNNLMRKNMSYLDNLEGLSPPMRNWGLGLRTWELGMSPLNKREGSHSPDRQSVPPQRVDDATWTGS